MEAVCCALACGARLVAVLGRGGDLSQAGGEGGGDGGSEDEDGGEGCGGLDEVAPLRRESLPAQAAARAAMTMMSAAVRATVAGSDTSSSVVWGGVDEHG